MSLRQDAEDAMIKKSVTLDYNKKGLRTSLPVLDRYSPLSYAIAQYVHWKLAPHRGAETCNRVSLENVHIMQGASLYRELGEQCGDVP